MLQSHIEKIAQKLGTVGIVEHRTRSQNIKITNKYELECRIRQTPSSGSCIYAHSEVDRNAAFYVIPWIVIYSVQAHHRVIVFSPSA